MGIYHFEDNEGYQYMVVTSEEDGNWSFEIIFDIMARDGAMETLSVENNEAFEYEEEAINYAKVLYSKEVIKFDIISH